MQVISQGNTSVRTEAGGRRRVLVAQVLSGRYAAGTKPLRWDERRSGVETIKTTEGEQVALFSSGGQSTPAAGWELMLTGEKKASSNNTNGECWTLYGIQRSQ